MTLNYVKTVADAQVICQFKWFAIILFTVAAIVPNSWMDGSLKPIAFAAYLGHRTSNDWPSPQLTELFCCTMSTASGATNSPPNQWTRQAAGNRI